jgi:hypothetical protein
VVSKGNLTNKDLVTPIHIQEDDENTKNHMKNKDNFGTVSEFDYMFCHASKFSHIGRKIDFRGSIDVIIKIYTNKVTDILISYHIANKVFFEYLITEKIN